MLEMIKVCDPTQVGAKMKETIKFFEGKMGALAAQPIALLHPIFFTQNCGEQRESYLKYFLAGRTISQHYSICSDYAAVHFTCQNCRLASQKNQTDQFDSYLIQ